MFLKRVYIASPYTVGDKSINVRNSLLVADQLIELGYAPFSPLLAHFQDIAFPRTYEEWLGVGIAWMVAADVVLRLPGESNGADIETMYAAISGIPVVYSIEELNQLFKS